jgi:hypothetical protein
VSRSRACGEHLSHCVQDAIQAAELEADSKRMKLLGLGRTTDHENDGHCVAIGM